MLVGQGIMRCTDSKRPYVGVSFIRLVQSKIAVLQSATTKLVFAKDPNVADKCIGARVAVTQSRLTAMTCTVAIPATHGGKCEQESTLNYTECKTILR